MKIEKFEIKKLHNRTDYNLEFRDNKLILIGENGSCKTTIIKILFYVLSAQWLKLFQYSFKGISITIDSESFSFDKEDLVDNEKLQREFSFLFPRSVRMQWEKEKNFDIDRMRSILSQRYPSEFIEENFESFIGKCIGCNNIIKELEKKLSECCFVYLPTYRRIEQDLEVILGKDLDAERNYSKVYSDNCRYIEMVRFGMSDVAHAISERLQILKDSFRTNLNRLTLGYLGDIIDNDYSNVDTRIIKKTTNETLMKIMGRVDDSILNDQKKKALLAMIEKVKAKSEMLSDHDKVLCHYVLKLLDLQKKMNKDEENIRQFVEICSNYIVNKKLEYDGSSFSFNIRSSTDSQIIDLKHLSSGEKQIVSLFSLLNLGPSKKYFILIDEPELSLSVKWQKRFLVDIAKSTNCQGLVAVTHSPFIFDNALETFARGIGEFKEIIK